MLRINGSKASSVFRLRGIDENSGTLALSWTLNKSPILLALFLQRIFDEKVSIRGIRIETQKHAANGGFTDLEIIGDGIHVIVEAKRWWSVVDDAQYNRYKPRLSQHLRHQRFVSVSAADEQDARRLLPISIKDEITHFSWCALQALASEARAKASGQEEKLWLRELIEHYKEYVSVDRVTNNDVYLVVLSADRIRVDNPYTYLDVVVSDGHYYHPIGKSGWPVIPPNYIGFRHKGKLLSVHHVDSFERVVSPSDTNPLWSTGSGEHVVYKLGPAMKPAEPLPNGKIYVTGRIWCAIDTLLSGAYSSIAEARDETKRRISAQ